MPKINSYPYKGPFVVATTGGDSQTLFLVDRKKTKKQWWTTELDGPVMQFISYKAAICTCDRLRHNKPRVLDLEEAEFEWDRNKYLQNYPHPFSSDGLGQL